MRMISKEALQALRERFPRGARVELVKMDDPQPPEQDPCPFGRLFPNQPND